MTGPDLSAHDVAVSQDPAAAEALRIAAMLRVALRAGPGISAEGDDRVEALLAELSPFVEAAARAEAAPELPALWQEARSLVYLFAYRLADQGYAPMALSRALTAWRDAVGSEMARQRTDEVQALLLEGFARGREDAAQSALQQSLGVHLPVGVLAPGVLLAVAAGPLAPDGARTLADRAGRELLRRDGQAALLDLTGLERPEPAVLAELWSLVSAARMLGAAMVTVGHAETVRAGLAEGTLSDAPSAVVNDFTEGVSVALGAAGLRIGAEPGLRRWIKRALGSTTGSGGDRGPGGRGP